MGQEVILDSNKIYFYLLNMPILFFSARKITYRRVKCYIGLFTFLHLKRAGRPERMGHNTCKSMGLLLFVERR